MQVFKTALRIFFKHPVYIGIYIFWLTAMAMFIGMSNVSAPEMEFTEDRPDVAIIDRDQSILSEGLTDFISKHSVVIEIDDSRSSMQDAVAQNQVSYIIIIPKGYGESFMDAATNNKDIAELETVVSYESIAANMMNSLVDEYLNTLEVYVATETATTQEDAVKLTAANMENSTETTMAQIGQSGPISQQWILYMSFSGYTIMLSIIVCVGVVMSGFNRTEIRRRDLTAPISTLSMNLQIALASVVIALLVWVWVSLFGLIAFHDGLTGVDWQIIGLIILALLAFCAVPLSIGFLFGQITSNELVMNAAGNIIGLIFSFLGGIWVSIDLMSESMASLAHFMPTYYFGEVISKAVDLQNYSLATLGPLFADIGIILLFAAAIFAIALAAGRLRAQSADAGGNAAAERIKS